MPRLVEKRNVCSDYCKTFKHVSIRQNNPVGDYYETKCFHCESRLIQCSQCDYAFELEVPKKNGKSCKTYYRRHYINIHEPLSSGDINRTCKRQATINDDSQEPVFEETDELDDWETIDNYRIESDSTDGLDDQKTLDDYKVDYREDKANPNVLYGLDEFGEVFNSMALPLENAAHTYTANQIYMHCRHIVKYKSQGTDDTGGFRHLTEKATLQRQTIGMASHKQTELLFSLNSVLLNSSRKESKEVMRLVRTLLNNYVNETVDTSNTPKTYRDARRMVIDGKFSTMANFPAPKVFEINDHACVSIKETILILAGHGEEFDLVYDAELETRSRCGLNGSSSAGRACVEVREVLRTIGVKDADARSYSIGLFYMWSDSFLNSFIKQKDNSVWVLTITILPNITIVLAIGKSGQDHTAVIEHFYQEIEELKRGFQCYMGSKNRIIKVAFNILYHSADRPEKHALRRTLQEGTYGRVSNYATDVSIDRLPSCKDCYRHLVKCAIEGHVVPTKQCYQCFNWTFDPKDPLQEICPVPKDYPKHTVLDWNPPLVHIMPPKGREPGRKLLGPVRLSSKWMIQSATYGYECRRQGIWSRPQFHSFMRSCSVNKSLADVILFHAEVDHSNCSFSDMKSILPRIWYLFDCFDRSMFPDMPLHLIAHGLGDDVIHFFESILKNFKKNTNFASFANAIISDIMTWYLDWCKLKEYPKSAWVGENIMAFLRLISYLYGMYLVNHPISVEEGSLLICSMARMTNSLQAMLSLLMSPKHQDAPQVLNHIKIFMSAFHQCDNEFNPRESNDMELSTTQKKNLSQIRVVDLLTDDEVMDVLCYIKVSPGRNKRETLNKQTANSLAATLSHMNLSQDGQKSDLQRRCFEAILQRSLDKATGTKSSTKTTSDVSNTQAEKKNNSWCKGGVLSMLANYIEQVDDLGQCHMIW